MIIAKRLRSPQLIVQRRPEASGGRWKRSSKGKDEFAHPRGSGPGSVHFIPLTTIPAAGAERLRLTEAEQEMASLIQRPSD